MGQILAIIEYTLYLFCSNCNFCLYKTICLILFFDLHALIHGGFYISTNDIPFLIPSLITGASIFGFGLLIIRPYGLMGLILLQFFCMAACNFWYSTYLSLKLLHWPFPIYVRNIILNGPRYWSNKLTSYIKKI